MNIFVAIMLGFAALGLFDKMIGGRLGLEKEFDQGMETAGGLALSTVGFYLSLIHIWYHRREHLRAVGSHQRGA